MAKYWIIAPGENTNGFIFNELWQFDLSNDLISIGWSELGDLSKKEKKDILEMVSVAFPDKPAHTKSLIVNMLWSFYNEIELGDVIIARKGRKELAGVGIVMRKAYYAPNTNPLISHSHFLNVKWKDTPRNISFPFIVFPMHTLSEFSEEKYRELVSGIDISVLESSDIIEDRMEFVLEKYLEEFIVSNFKSIFKDAYYIFQGPETGRQYSTDIGSIDILAVERESNNFVVIELKKGQPSDKVVGQILRYMGWVKHHLCVNGELVKGLIISKEPDEKLKYALKATYNVNIQYYSVSFKLTENSYKL
jgi:restriction system protein